jgi:DnaK suppressor protein
MDRHGSSANGTPEPDECCPKCFDRQRIDRGSGGAYHVRFAVKAAKRAYMEKEKLEHFRKLLEARRIQLRESVARTEEDGRAAQAADTAQDIADHASSSYQKEFLFAQSSSERRLLQMVERALSRISEGAYGECEQCGSEINERRLEAVPWARHCIACQEKLERGELEQPARER